MDANCHTDLIEFKMPRAGRGAVDTNQPVDLSRLDNESNGANTPCYRILLYGCLKI